VVALAVLARTGVVDCDDDDIESIFILFVDVAFPFAAGGIGGFSPPGGGRGGIDEDIGAMLGDKSHSSQCVLSSRYSPDYSYCKPIRSFLLADQSRYLSVLHAITKAIF